MTTYYWACGPWKGHETETPSENKGQVLYAKKSFHIEASEV